MSEHNIDRRTTLGLMAATALSTSAFSAFAQEGTALLLTAEWTGSYGGVPPFDKVDINQFEAAYDAAMASQRREIAAITGNPEPATFDNTIVPYERSGKALGRVGTIYGIWNGNLATAELQAMGKTIQPKLAAFSDELIQNPKLFARIKLVWDNKAKFNLTPEQDRLLWQYYTNFVRAGAALSPKAKTRVAAINKELSLLFKTFSDNLLHDEEQVMVVSEAELAGLPDGLKASMKLADGSYGIANTRSAMEPVTTFCTDRGVREKVWRAYVNRGDNGDQWDNNAIISKILKLRFERAQLRGYETHAHWRLENAMAKTPANAMALMEAVWGPAVARVHEEVADMQAVADKEGAGITIEPWDYRFYAEKVRKAKYDLDENEVKPYLQMEKLREGMMWAAGQIYGFEFTQIQGVPVFHDDVRVWKVTRGGKTVGLWYFDPYARKGKRSGAWMNAYRSQQRMDGKDIITLVSNNSNFIKAAPGEPILISWDDAKTLFHEFGHAIHGLSSNVTYPSLSGTNVARDYVEFPSQLNEHWLPTKEVLSRFALHYETGEAMPEALLAKIEKADTFNQGFATVEYLASALIDMKLHLAGGADIDADAFESAELTKLSMPKEIVMRHRTPQFGHVFSSDGYSAGYYSYLWSDTLTADCAEAFTEAGGFYDKAVADRLQAHVLSVGNTVDPADGYRAFRRRDPNRDALMRKRGFPVK
ncbi:peptidase M3 [Asticcacaulis sp. AC460]|uniref:M3 family metallopeptidase n=1 Tax=Asticcacaulis sp. AC460 TaxID=1282360 RepID=UPI0003C3B74C|nr:M3 family metallopeptidase [Asticcacaulis sp. AC460]ESQ92736.1 peptidase M3 [Asticcacaulis sp. AC460]